MRFPRNTDVSRHLARKPRLSIVPIAHAVAAAEQAALNSLSQDLSAAIDGAHASTKDGKQ